MTFSISVLARDGSPLGPSSKTIYGDAYRVGVGGAELAMLTMCEEWTKRGYVVKLYNSPWEQGVSSFEQLPTSAFNPHADMDVVITFRSPNPAINSCNCLKTWWSTDQSTIGNFAEFAPTQDKIVVISPYHQKHFQDVYGIQNSIVIDLPVRMDDYKDKVERIENRCIFTSVPARGLDALQRVWRIITRDFPAATLVITSDYRLWGCAGSTEPFRLKWMDQKNFEYLAAVPRSRLVLEQLQADLHVYPGIYEELFCYAVAESQVAGAIPITTAIGALETTNMGVVLPLDMNFPHGDKAFADAVMTLLNDKERKEQLRTYVQTKALVRFDPETILQKWDTEVFGL